MKFSLFCLVNILVLLNTLSDLNGQTVIGKRFFFDMNIPINTSYSSTVYLPNYSTRSGHGELNIRDKITPTLILSSNSQSGNTVDLVYYSDPSYEGSYSIHFVFDTILKKIINFSIIYNKTVQGGFAGFHENSALHFDELNYHLESNHSVVVNYFGDSCRRKVVSCDYSQSQYQNSSQGQMVSASSTTFDSLSTDTASYRCSLLVVPDTIKSSVFNKSSTHAFFRCLTSIITKSVFFSFSETNETQSFLIYDLLGREIKRLEIPSGVSEYRLERDGFMSGYYFARLGNLNAKFVVN